MKLKIIIITTIFIICLGMTAYAENKIMTINIELKSPYSWSASETVITSELCSIAFNRNGYVATGFGSDILYSKDGYTWDIVKSNLAPSESKSIYVNSIAENKDVFVAFSKGDWDWDATVFYSNDGINWVKNPLNQEKNPNGEFKKSEMSGKSTLWNGKIFVTEGNHGVGISQNGIDWELVSMDSSEGKLFLSGNNFIRDIVTGGGLYISSDGKEWSKTCGNLNFIKKAFVYNGSTFILTAGYNIYTSKDFINWNEVNNRELELDKIIWTGEYFVAIRIMLVVLIF